MMMILRALGAAFLRRPRPQGDFLLRRQPRFIALGYLSSLLLMGTTWACLPSPSSSATPGVVSRNGDARLAIMGPSPQVRDRSPPTASTLMRLHRQLGVGGRHRRRPAQLTDFGATRCPPRPAFRAARCSSAARSPPAAAALVALIPVRPLTASAAPAPAPGGPGPRPERPGGHERKERPRRAVGRRPGGRRRAPRPGRRLRAAARPRRVPGDRRRGFPSSRSLGPCPCRPAPRRSRALGFVLLAAWLSLASAAALPPCRSLLRSGAGLGASCSPSGPASIPMKFSTRSVVASSGHDSATPRLGGVPFRVRYVRSLVVVETGQRSGRHHEQPDPRRHQLDRVRRGSPAART